MTQIKIGWMLSDATDKTVMSCEPSSVKATFDAIKKLENFLGTRETATLERISVGAEERTQDSSHPLMHHQVFHVNLNYRIGRLNSHDFSNYHNAKFDIEYYFAPNRCSNTFFQKITIDANGRDPKIVYQGNTQPSSVISTIQ